RSRVFGRHNIAHLSETEVNEIDAGSAACMIVRMAALDRVGFFDPRYFMFGEDLDRCYRLKLGGWKVFYLPSASAIHHKGAATKQAERKMLYERHRAMCAYHSTHHANDISAFANGLVWLQLRGRWAASAMRQTVGQGRRPAP